MNETGKFTPSEVTTPEEGDKIELSPDLGLSFKDAIYLFNPEDQKEAERFLTIYKKCSNLSGTEFFELWRILSSFINSLEKSEQEDVQATNLFHLFSGSSKPPKNWKESPLKSKSGKLEAFILGDYLRKLEELENEK